MLTIGVAGERGAGKQAFCDAVTGCIPSSRHFSTSVDILAPALKCLGKDKPSAHDLQQISIWARNHFGPDVISDAMRRVINSARVVGFEVVLWDSIRTELDLITLRSFPTNLLVYISTPEELRFQRIKLRKEKHGEGEMTLEEYRKSCQVETEIFIPELAKVADRIIDNSGPPLALVRQVRGLLDVHPRLK